MALTTGIRLGIYEITGPLGQGGMGEVYRARDTTLGREVAIKTLPSALAQEPDRLARFEREAKLLAALNHPHIAVVYGLDEHEGTKYLAMELIEGETLERKAQGALPVEEALRIALQIAEALEAAHEKGVVHRDLKPANIMITRDGQVKVLDFGLAKAFSGDPSSTMVANSPALSLAMTQQGFILGTAGYMSPEQASGQATDQRADIWAFGVVLFELLTGKPLFSGESVPHVLADVLRTPPEWSRLPKNLHPRLKLLLERCLEKNARNRYHSIADVRVDIEKVLADPHGATARSDILASPTPSWQRALPWAAGMGLAAIVGLAAWNLKPADPRPPTRFVHALPEDRAPSIIGLNVLAIAPDGRRFVYGGSQGLYLRRMDAIEDTPIAGPVGFSPAFSPDGESVVFLRPVGTSGGALELARAPVIGGAAVSLARLGGAVQTGYLGTSWENDGTILYSMWSGIWRVPDSGGEPARIIEAGPGEQPRMPQLLPGGEWVLFTVARGNPARWDEAEIVVQSIATGERRVLRAGATAARYAPTGHLVYAIGNTLYAARFDAQRLELASAPTPVVQGVRWDVQSGESHYAFASNGTLVYIPGTSATLGVSFAIADRDGRLARLPISGGPYDHPRVSPDSRQIAYTATYTDGDDIAIYEIGSNAAPRRLTFGGRSRLPIWSADGARIAFQSTRDDAPGIYWQLADGTGAAERLTTPGQGDTHIPDDFSGDGELLSYTVAGAQGAAVWALVLATKEARSLVAVPGAHAAESVFSPDGNWLAYQQIDESGRPEIFVQRFPITATRYQLPQVAGNHHPVWSADGSELLFVPIPYAFAAVPITTQPSFTFGNYVILPLPLRDGPPYERRRFDVMPDGSGFLVTVQGSDLEATRSIHVVENWFEELRRLVPTE